MSWNGFVKAVNRATTSVMQSAGAVEKTIDKEYEAEERRFRNLESKVERLHKEAKGYLDAVRGTTVAQQRIAEVIDGFYDESSKLHNAGRLYRDATNRMDEEVRTELDANYRLTVLDPVGKLIGVFPEFNDAIKKRSKKLLDYDRLRSGARRLVDKPADDPTKLPKAEAEANQARDVYENLNRQIKSDVPELINMRVAYLNPSFEAIVKSQLAFNEGAFHKLDSIKTAFPEGYERGLEGRVEGVLQQMRELSISTAHTTPMATVASTLASASVSKVAAATAVTTADATAVAAAAASSHSSARRRSKVTGISGTQHAVSVAALAALAALAANDHSADSVRSMTGRKSRKSKPTVSATPIRGSTLPVQHDQSDMDNYDHSVGDANTTKGASSGAKKDKRRGRTKKPALLSTEPANEDADEKHYNYGCFLGVGLALLPVLVVILVVIVGGKDEFYHVRNAQTYILYTYQCI
ncbi:hypothetical protein BASA50_003166 [Batrachochytrium salamandrivorans]|uniref:BAR domain-containing protein n=1 Tax=Batrachochytrium salamandrivorans TaxID=1357716 RepID=A0ABQ8FJ79_9FUNG|nr:hypothetical protein BASA50_003166 [Batrachochytrium salamandrivorans]